MTNADRAREFVLAEKPQDLGFYGPLIEHLTALLDAVEREAAIDVRSAMLIEMQNHDAQKEHSLKLEAQVAALRDLVRRLDGMMRCEATDASPEEVQQALSDTAAAATAHDDRIASAERARILKSEMVSPEFLEEVRREAREDEREQCAKVADGYAIAAGGPYQQVSKERNSACIAAAIRARGKA